jgi:hypothetical protein
MRECRFAPLGWMVLLIALLPAAAEVVYTPVNASIAIGDSYSVDLNHDGVADFTLRSRVLQSYCQFGNGAAWSLTVTPALGNGVVIAVSDRAAALVQGTGVGRTQSFSFGTALMTELDWGHCGRGLYGEWLGYPDRYLGLEFRRPGSSGLYYGWAKLTDAAYVDEHGNLHARTIVQGFAYETVAGRRILTGQTTE